MSKQPEHDTDTEAYPWDSYGDRKPVDSAGCLWGEIHRPARVLSQTIVENTETRWCIEIRSKTGSLQIDAEHSVNLTEWR